MSKSYSARWKINDVSISISDWSALGIAYMALINQIGAVSLYFGPIWQGTGQSTLRSRGTGTGPKPLIFCGECDNSLALGALILGEI